MKDWRTLRLGGQHWSFLWIFTLVTLLHAAPDPAAWHELSEAEYELVLRDLHPPRPASWDSGLARAKRQAGLQTFEYNSEDADQGPWEEWGPPSPCSRWGLTHNNGVECYC